MKQKRNDGLPQLAGQLSQTERRARLRALKSLTEGQLLPKVEKEPKFEMHVRPDKDDNDYFLNDIQVDGSVFWNAWHRFIPWGTNVEFEVTVTKKDGED